MIFRQLYDSTSSTYSYLLADEASREGVLIDPVFEQHRRDAALVRELGLKLRYTLDTHCHADHVTGAWLMKQAHGSQVAMSEAIGAQNVDVALKHGDRVVFGQLALDVRATPGHTDGCLSFVSLDGLKVFTGDALLVRGAGRTDFQQGNAHRLYQSIQQQLFSLSDECIVYPGHDYDGRTSSTIGEEKAWNPRIGGGAKEEDFVGYMENLGLPHPKQLAVAVPANLRAGKPEAETVGTTKPWGPVVTTYAGLLEISPEWVALHRSEVRILDVRSEAEFNGELGHLNGAELIPLDQLRERAAELSGDEPIVVVCQTGKRAALGTVILAKAGFTQIANLAGGMVAWRGLGLPLAGMVLGGVLLLLSAAAYAGKRAPLPEKYERSPYALMSLTVGAPNNGYQIRAKRLRESEHLDIKSDSHRRVYGHPALVLMLHRSAQDIAKAAPNSVMLVGDLSHDEGGPMSKHRSHQSGRDADIGFYVRNEKGDQVKLNRFVKIDDAGKVIGMRGAYFDDERNWQLVRSWLRDKRAGISHVFVASHIRSRLLKYARDNSARRRFYDAAASLLKQPSNSSMHDDHYHLRIRCPEQQRDICVEQAQSD